MREKQHKFIFEKIINVFAWISFFLAIVLAMVALFASFSGEQNGKEIFGHKALIVTSDSMSKSPLSEGEKIFFEAGDLIIIKKIEDPASLKVGDVITFFSYNPDSMGKTVSHKIREIKYSAVGEVTGIITYGINTGVNDLVEVKPEHLIGKYVFKISNVGHLFSFLKTPRGFYLSVLIPGVLLIMFFSIKVGRVLGKHEYAKQYNEEIELLKERIAILEKGGLSQNMDEREKQQSEQGQDVCAIYQTVSITYDSSTTFPQPIIYQTAPSKSVPVHQTVNISPAQEDVGKQGKGLALNQIIIYQMVGDNFPSFPKPLVCVGQPKTENDNEPLDALEEELATTKDESSESNDKGESAEENKENNINVLNAQKKSFTEKITQAKEETQNYFNAIHNEFASYKKVSSRVSFRCVSYRKGRELLAKISIRGKTLRAYFNLNVLDFNERVFFQKDMSSIKAYEEVPFGVKIKSGRGLNNAIKLVDAIAEKFELKKNDKFEAVDKIKQLKEENKIK